MGYIRLDEQPGEVYHYTHRKNLDSILRDGRIRRMGDRECWFCASLEDTLTLMRATVMMEGKPYYKVGGSIGRYPKFVPEDYVILRLNPRFQKGEWVQWMQDMPPESPPELLKDQGEKRRSLCGICRKEQKAASGKGNEASIWAADTQNI